MLSLPDKRLHHLPAFTRKLRRAMSLDGSEQVRQMYPIRVYAARIPRRVVFTENEVHGEPRCVCTPLLNKLHSCTRGHPHVAECTCNFCVALKLIMERGYTRSAHGHTARPATVPFYRVIAMKTRHRNFCFPRPRTRKEFSSNADTAKRAIVRLQISRLKDKRLNNHAPPNFHRNRGHCVSRRFVGNLKLTPTFN